MFTHPLMSPKLITNISNCSPLDGGKETILVEDTSVAINQRRSFMTLGAENQWMLQYQEDTFGMGTQAERAKKSTPFALSFLKYRSGVLSKSQHSIKW